MKREPLDWTNRTGRRSVSHVGSLRLVNGAEVRALVTNLSFEGCQVVSEKDLAVGETVLLTIPGRGCIEGQVRWCSEDLAGIRFVLGDSAGEARRIRVGV